MESTNPNTDVVADVLAGRPRQISPIAAPCVSWERSHASTRVTTTGGVRLLPAMEHAAGRLIASYASTSFPSSGPSTLSPPV